MDILMVSNLSSRSDSNPKYVAHYCYFFPGLSPERSELIKHIKALLVWQQLMVNPSSDSSFFCYWSEQISLTRLLIKGLYVLRSLMYLLS